MLFLRFVAVTTRWHLEIVRVLQPINKFWTWNIEKIGSQRERKFHNVKSRILKILVSLGPPLWSRCQNVWLQAQRSRVRFPALTDFLSSSSYETGSTQPREDKWWTIWKISSSSGLENSDYRPWGIRGAENTTPLYPQMLALKFAHHWQSLSRYIPLADYSKGV
jgi:hypothetical protein